MNRTRLITYVTFTAFIGLAVFGFAVMGSHDMEGHSDCIATMGQTTLCSHDNPLALAELHNQFFRKITSSIGNSDIIALLTSIMALAGLTWLTLKYLSSPRQQAESHIAFQLGELAFITSRSPLLRWLTLREKIGPALS